jgi:site-specific DNA recombinase
MTGAQAKKIAVGMKPKMVRCAIYTRKSTDEGLDMDFNSLDAQREAAEAFISSQRHEGWVVLPEKFDDGGFTGGNMERPALKRLMAEVEAGNIDAIVVYKVDRLSRSLLDFSRIMETLDSRGCSFVSVTQQFNTTHSMGRLTLNILLSFAQFEREIISERTRDKMSAARKKGKWVGGGLILGYDLDQEARRLVVNPVEADQVRAIFNLYLEIKSVLGTAAELNRRGWPRKSWIAKNGKQTGGGMWTKPNLLGLLQNVAYLGRVQYRGEIHTGEHEAILDEKVWAKAQAILKRNARERGASARNRHGALLRKILHCGPCGCAMTHTYTQKDSRRYRYYVCQTAMKRGWNECQTRSVPAQEIEDFVIQRIAAIGVDAALSREVAEQAQRDLAEKREILEKEREQINQTLRKQSRMVPQIFGQSNVSAHLANLQEQIRAGENRLAEIAVEIAGLGAEVSESNVTEAIGRFSDLVAAMAIEDRVHLLQLLVERVAFDREKGTVTLSFHPSGFEAILEQPV